MEKRERKKDWKTKTILVQNCVTRCLDKPGFTRTFYEKLFFLKPELKIYFKNTDWYNQERLLAFSLDHLVHVLTNPEDNHHQDQLIRISETHSKKNMNIHPHDYYYWIDAMILTIKEHDQMWEDDYQYYLRECLFHPISFIISRYLC